MHPKPQACQKWPNVVSIGHTSPSASSPSPPFLPRFIGLRTGEGRSDPFTQGCPVSGASRSPASVIAVDSGAALPCVLSRPELVVGSGAQRQCGCLVGDAVG